MIKIANLATRSVRYLESGHGAPLVLLHAFPLNAEQWLPQLDRSGQGWRVIAPDLRGFRGSEPFAGGESPTVTVDTYADDVLQLMMHLDVPRAVIGGLSMGGYVALAIVRKAAARVAGLVLANTRATADTEEGRAGRDRMLHLAGHEGPSGVATVMLPRLLGETTRREQPDLADAVRLLIEANSTAGIQAAVTAMKERPDSTPLLGTITCPTTIIAGEEDAITPPVEAEEMQRAIRGARLVILPRAGHLSNLENPLGFNAALFSHPIPAGVK